VLAAAGRKDFVGHDLHGKFLEEGTLDGVDQFLYEQFNKGETAVEIVYGIGEGKMRKFVLDFLMKHPLIEEYNNGEKCIIENPGSCIVVLTEKNI